jgi:hypothetical protein
MDEGSSGRSPIAAEALADYGYPERPLDTDRTGVILGTRWAASCTTSPTLRVHVPEFARCWTA